MATDNRPISPNLQVYRPQLTSVLSFGHRTAGLLLSLGMVLVVAWLVALAAGPGAFDSFNACFESVPARLGLLVLTLALYYHLLNGIRHLLWDSGLLLKLRSAYLSGWTVVVLTFVLTVITWGALL